MRKRPRPALYIGPAFLMLFLVLLSPVLYGAWFSLFRIEYGAPAGFAGLENYARLLTDPSLGPTIWNSVVFTTLAVAVTIGVALAVAVWIHRLPARVAMIAQMVVIVPWIVSTIVATLLFRWVFVNDIGLANALMQMLGAPAFQPLNSPTGAMALLVAVSAWKRIGYAALVLLAGLKSVPDELHEAAAIDGASGWQAFYHIILPLLKTPLLLVAIVITLANLNTVETPLVLTGGGPGGATHILALDVYERAFVNYDLGGATALALLMFGANIVLVLSYVRLSRWQG